MDANTQVTKWGKLAYATKSQKYKFKMAKCLFETDVLWYSANGHTGHQRRERAIPQVMQQRIHRSVFTNV